MLQFLNDTGFLGFFPWQTLFFIFMIGATAVRQYQYNVNYFEFLLKKANIENLFNFRHKCSRVLITNILF